MGKARAREARGAVLWDLGFPLPPVFKLVPDSDTPDLDGRGNDGWQQNDSVPGEEILSPKAWHE